jgi:hypothetical protein
MSEILQEIWRALPALRLLFSHAREGGHPYNFGHTRSCRRVSRKPKDGFPIKNVGNDRDDGFPINNDGDDSEREIPVARWGAC